MASLPAAIRPSDAIIGERELYAPQSDPDTEAIALARKRIAEIDRMINENVTRIAAIETKLAQLRKRANEEKARGNVSGVKQTEAEAVTLLKQKAQREAETNSLRQRRQNFELSAENLRKQKREEEDEKLLRDLNVRLKVGQETLDIAERQRTVTDARTLNRQVGQMGTLLDSPLDLDDTFQRDELLLAEFNTLALPSDDMAMYDSPVPQQQSNVRNNSKTILDNEY